MSASKEAAISVDQRYAYNRDVLFEMVLHGTTLLDLHEGRIEHAQEILEVELIKAFEEDPERACTLASLAIMELAWKRSPWL